MTETTPLDTAHAAMEAAPGDDKARLHFFERLADAELFLMLTEEARDDRLSPEIFDVADSRLVLAFDREDRLAAFAGRPVPYAALSGRALAGLLAGQGMGLGLNLEVASSSTLLPAEAMGWLAETLEQGPDRVETGIETVSVPSGLPETLLTALDTKLATAAGLAPLAYLAGVTYRGGGQGHLLGFVDAVPGAEHALAGAVSEALTFSGLEAAALDVGFFAASDAMAGRLAAVGLRIDLPVPEKPEPPQRSAPGSDPDKPPILR